MFRPIAIAALTAPIAIVAPAMAQDISQVQRHLSAVTSMTADFSQTDRTGKTLNGAVTLKKPGKVRFQYGKGVPILIVGDGRSLYFVDYSVRQVQRWPVGNSPLDVLLKPGADISRYATVQPTTNPDVVSIEVRDPRRPEFGRITLIFARDASGPAGLMLEGWVALDAQNGRTTVRLTNQRFNVPVSDGTFRWNDPRSTGARNR